MWPDAKQKAETGSRPAKRVKKVAADDIRRHASVLYTALLGSGADKPLKDGELHAAYRILCEDMDLTQIPWGSVKEAYVRLVGGEMHYERTECNGSVKRVRIHPIPTEPLPDAPVVSALPTAIDTKARKYKHRIKSGA